MGGNFIYKILLIIIFNQAALLSFSQMVQFLPLTPLNKKELLPGLNTRKIVRDHLGYMWVATQDGLYRYDGRRAVFYNSGASDARFVLNGTDIFDLALADNGEYLWALSNNGGITCISIEEGTVKSSFSLPGQLWSKSLAVRGNNLYVGTAEGVIIAVDGKKKAVRAICTLSTLYQHSGPVENILIDERGNVWALVSGLGVFIADAGLKAIRMIPSSEMFLAGGAGAAREVQFTDMAVYKHNLLISSSAGVSVVDLQSMDLLPVSRLFNDQSASFLSRHIDCIAIDQHSVLFAGPGLLLLAEPDAGSCRQIRFSRDKKDIDWLLYTSSLLFDGKSIWIGGQYGTAWVKDINTPFTAFYDSMDSLDNKLRHCMTLFHKDQSALYVCADDGLYLLSIGNGTIRKLSGQKVYYSGAFISRHSLVASGVHGTEVFDEGGKQLSFEHSFPELAILGKESLVAMENYHDSLYFFAAFDPDKIFCWDRCRRNIRKIPGSRLGGKAKGYFVKRLFVDSKSRLWILFDASISIYDPATDKVEELSLFLPGSKEPVGINMDICEADGHYWIAAYGKGVLELSASGQVEKLYTMKEGLHNLGLYRVAPLNDSLVMSSSNDGLAIINKKSQEVTNYFEEDGLHSNYFEQFSGDYNGRYLFLGGLKGLTMIDPKKLQSISTVSPLFVTSVRTQSGNGVRDTFRTGLDRIKIPSYVIQVNINFTVINYVLPERDHFSYRIPEVDDNWISIGNQRSIPLMGLSPGVYTVEIRNDGIVKTADASIAVIKLIWQPHWYQTWWFKLSMVLVIAGLAYFLFRYRISQIRQQQQIRKNIASDLHDDLGSTLNALKVYSHLARKEPQKEEHLNQIEESLGQATSGLRDMVWVLDDPDDTLSGVLDRLRKFAMPLALAKGIQLYCEAEEELPKGISKTEKQNLFMIAKEGINNAIKYADCRTIRVTFRQYKHAISLTIKDDGKGFDSARTVAGNGLGNIRYRAQQIKYTVNILSFPGGGTTIEVMKN